MFVPTLNGIPIVYHTFITKKFDRYGRILYDNFVFYARTSGKKFIDLTKFELCYSKGRSIHITGYMGKKYYKNNRVWIHTLHIQNLEIINNYSLIDFL